MRRHVAAGSLAVGVVAVCFIVRSVVQAAMALGQEIPVIPGLFSLRYVRNPGAAFGLFAAAPAKFRLPFFLGVAIFALFAITVIYLREGHESRRLRLGLAMLAGGAGANLLERLLVGEVVDYLDVYVGTHHWPTFNLADIAINVGVGLLLLETFRDRGASRRAPTGREEGRP
jgi:signal peptidase II